jgi:antitoxin MazE
MADDVITRPSKIAQWGNSAAVRIGSAVLARAHLAISDPVDITASDDEIVIRRKRPAITMAELLANFDPEKHRRDVSFDVDPVGVETR